MVSTDAYNKAQILQKYVYLLNIVKQTTYIKIGYIRKLIPYLL